MNARYGALDAELVAFHAERERRDPLKAVLFALTDLGQVTPAELAEAVDSAARWIAGRPALERVAVKRGERLVLVLRAGALDDPTAASAARNAGELLNRGGSRVLMVDGGQVAQLALVPAGAEVEIREVRPVEDDGELPDMPPPRRELADDEPDDAGQTAADVARKLH